MKQKNKVFFTEDDVLARDNEKYKEGCGKRFVDYGVEVECGKTYYGDEGYLLCPECKKNKHGI
jgi:hypothetical protein